MSVRVTIAWASPSAQGTIDVALPDGATVADAIAASDALARAGVNAAQAGYAIFGQAVGPATPLADGDRVEVTRPLVADARTVRRDRARARPLPPVKPRTRLGRRR